MSGKSATHAEVRAIELMQHKAVARIFQQNWGQWWAELWVPRTETSPPPSPFDRPGWPDDVPGFEREGIALKSTRRGAIKAAREMRDRYEVGLPCDPEDEKPGVEIIA